MEWTSAVQGWLCVCVCVFGVCGSVPIASGVTFVCLFCEMGANTDEAEWRGTPLRCSDPHWLQKELERGGVVFAL